MSELKSITLEQLKQTIEKGASAFKSLPCMDIVTKNGDYIGTLIIPAVEGGMRIYDHIQLTAESLGVQSNIVYPQGKGEIPAPEAEQEEEDEGLQGELSSSEDTVDKPEVQEVPEKPAGVSLKCPKCEFEAKTLPGLKNHMKAHKKK